LKCFLLQISNQAKLIMSAFKTLPMDIVKYILLYDSRFVLRNGKIIQINKLDMNKYKTIALNLLLIKKPKVTYHFWKSPLVFWCDVRFSNGHRVFYSVNKENYNGHFNDHMLYSYESRSKCPTFMIVP